MLLCCSHPGAGVQARRRPTDRAAELADARTYHLSLDLHRSEGCTETSVSTRTRGRITVVVDRYQPSRLTVDLSVMERTAPAPGAARGRRDVTSRQWQRVYPWAGQAGFMGTSAQLHLGPVGSGCVHRSLAGIRGAGCPTAVPPVVVECSPARLEDRPRDHHLRASPPGGSARPHLSCRVEVSGPRDRVQLPLDLRFLSGPLVLTLEGQPELVLRRFEALDQVEGELRRPGPP